MIIRLIYFIANALLKTYLWFLFTLHIFNDQLYNLNITTYRFHALFCHQAVNVTKFIHEMFYRIGY